MSAIFEGVRVIDFTNNIAGPLSTAIMADFGAEVIKIEKLEYGDDSRQFPPFVNEVSVGFSWHNRGKKSVCIDLKTSEGIELTKKLICTADVVIESFRPGVIGRLGLGYEELRQLKPDIIMGSISAFGQTGPYRDYPGYDILAQAVSGMMALCGSKESGPTKIGPSIADYIGGMIMFGSISAALYKHQVSGEGQFIDISLTDSLVFTNDLFENIQINGLERTGNHHGMLAPYGVFKGNNGNIALGILNNEMWYRALKVFEKEDLIGEPRFATMTDRLHNLPEIIDFIEAWLGEFANIDDAIFMLRQNRIPCAKVTEINEISKEPQLIAREMVFDWELPAFQGKKVTARGSPYKFSGNPIKFHEPPKLGEHTSDYLIEIGLSNADVERLRTSNVIN